MSSHFRRSVEADLEKTIPRATDYNTRSTWSAADLIQLSKDRPPEPIIEGLLFKGDLLVLHGKEESYKSMLVVQVAESIACGRPLLRMWNVPQPRRAGLIETEM